MGGGGGGGWGGEGGGGEGVANTRCWGPAYVTDKIQSTFPWGLDKLTGLNMIPVGWLGHKTSAQTNNISYNIACAPSEGWSEYSLCAWRRFGTLSAHNETGKDSDPTA